MKKSDVEFKHGASFLVMTPDFGYRIHLEFENEKDRRDRI